MTVAYTKQVFVTSERQFIYLPYIQNVPALTILQKRASSIVEEAFHKLSVSGSYDRQWQQTNVAEKTFFVSKMRGAQEENTFYLLDVETLLNSCWDTHVFKAGLRCFTEAQCFPKTMN